MLDTFDSVGNWVRVGRGGCGLASCQRIGEWTIRGTGPTEKTKMKQEFTPWKTVWGTRKKMELYYTTCSISKQKSQGKYQLRFQPSIHHVFSRVWVFVTPRTVACQAPLFMEFSRQEYWSGLPFPPPGDLPDPGIEPMSPVSPALQADSLLLEPSTGEAHRKIILGNNNNYPRTAMSLLLRIGSQHFLNWYI